MRKDRLLNADNSAGFVEVAPFCIVEPGKAFEGHAVELEIAGVAQATLPPATNAISDAVVSGKYFGNPAQPPGRTERLVLRIKYEE